jgi:hypothetical protein
LLQVISVVITLVSPHPLQKDARTHVVGHLIAYQKTAPPGYFTPVAVMIVANAHHVKCTSHPSSGHPNFLGRLAFLHLFFQSMFCEAWDLPLLLMMFQQISLRGLLMLRMWIPSLPADIPLWVEAVSGFCGDRIDEDLARAVFQGRFWDAPLAQTSTHFGDAWHLLSPVC